MRSARRLRDVAKFERRFSDTPTSRATGRRANVNLPAGPTAVPGDRKTFAGAGPIRRAAAGSPGRSTCGARQSADFDGAETATTTTTTPTPMPTPTPLLIPARCCSSWRVGRGIPTATRTLDPSRRHPSRGGT